mmetsp:Transcript_24808/g.71683  ORF Transcript_24808/g.71683 Transcript_24808/m.71683 type:complete len:258 (+) Transcript_24808:838-1611(+)
MNDGCNLVREHKYLLLKRFRCICKLTDIAEQKNAFHNRALAVQGNAFVLLGILGLLIQTLTDDFHSGCTETNLHERSDSKNGGHEEVSFHALQNVLVPRCILKKVILLINKPFVPIGCLVSKRISHQHGEQTHHALDGHNNECHHRPCKGIDPKQPNEDDKYGRYETNKSLIASLSPVAEGSYGAAASVGDVDFKDLALSKFFRANGVQIIVCNIAGRVLVAEEGGDGAFPSSRYGNALKFIAHGRLVVQHHHSPHW